MDHERFDELLDRVLASYSAAEPLSGLDERVLIRVRGTAKQVGRAFSVSGGLALACAVALTVAVVVIGGHKPGVSTPLQMRTSSQAPAPVRSEVREAARVRLTRRRREKPARVGPSYEELLLVQLAVADPAGAAKAFASVRESAARDLNIEPIKRESLQ